MFNIIKEIEFLQDCVLLTIYLLIINIHHYVFHIIAENIIIFD